MHMGLLDRLAIVAAPTKPQAQVIATDTYYGQSVNSLWYSASNIAVSRAEAMQVPAVARARNIICSTIGSLPLERYSTLTKEELTPIPLFEQPDPNSPRSVTWSWLADSIFFYGVGYLQILSTYAEDGRPQAVRWIDPNRVQPAFNNTQTLVVGYNLDGNPLPMEGVGSLIAFNGQDEGLLSRAGRTIRTALELEQAAYRAAQEPSPQSVLKSTGVDLPADKVTALLTKWKEARQSRSTAYLYSGIDLQTVGFDPKSQQLVEARQFHASEIARAAGIPAWYLNAETASMTYSNTEQERRTLIDFSLRPILSAVEDRLSMSDVTPRAVIVRFDIDDFLRGSYAERVDISTKLLAAGIVDVPEARKIADLPPTPERPQA